MRSSTRQSATAALSAVSWPARALTAVAAEGGEAAVIVADVADPAEVERMVAEAVAGLGGLDGLVANVGVVGPRSLEATDAAAWDEIFAINVRAHFLACKHALGVLAPGSAIVLNSSIAGRMPINRSAAYHAAKSALDGMCLWQHLTRSGLRLEVSTGGGVTRESTAWHVAAPGTLDLIDPSVEPEA
jgi:NAD(P)-dependent dehydrogenase (short-subunit alcohol dehydrogenase family)